MAPLGAIALALFTIAATVVAYPFWTLKGIERGRSIETFLEHVGLAAAFLLVVWRQCVPSRSGPFGRRIRETSPKLVDMRHQIRLKRAQDTPSAIGCRQRSYPGTRYR
jgi:hypothetical protein